VGSTPDDASPPEPRREAGPARDDPAEASARGDDGADADLHHLGRRTVIRGATPESDYVRLQYDHTHEFRWRGDGLLEATENILRPRTRAGAGVERVRRALLGQRLPTAEQVHERLTKVKALAVLSSDAISSVAYGTEASLAILIVAGTAALRDNLAIAGCIAVLMLVVGTSYRQTIRAYPHGGGSYIVARDNLGDWPGLVAAAALLIDYVLTVSVSVSSGVDALLSAVPALGRVNVRLGGFDLTASVVLGVLCIALIMLVNLRGIRESGTIFAAPTYLFIGCFFIMVLVGVAHAALSPGGLLHAAPPAVSPRQLGWTVQRVSLVLLLTAFASGCSAMTGVEAISNGVPAFEPPEADNAARTLAWMIGILVTLFVGTTYLAWRFGIEPNAAQNPTVDAQIAALLFGGPFRWFFYVIQVATLLILVLAANTSFADFPRLSSILARDHFLPHQFAFRGDRLAFSTGIIVLAALSSLLLIRFEGHTNALINLYALGVFTAFTLSQGGMVVRWWRRREAAGPRWRRSLAINLLGAVVTGIVAGIIIATKFDRGAWIVVVLIPLLVLLFRGIERHYATVERHTVTPTPSHPELLHHIAVVPIPSLNRPAVQGLAFAYSITPHVLAVHVATDGDEEARLRGDWSAWAAEQRPAWERMAARNGHRATSSQRPAGPRLVIIESPYRSLIPPLVAYIDAIRDDNPDATVNVVLPEFVAAHWWEQFLHNQTALRLKLALYSDPGVVVVNVPYHLPR
jgi:amino acid transporter